LHGGCQVPLGAYATVADNTVHLKALLTDPYGKRHLVAEHVGSADEPEALGHLVAQQLLDRGARDILAQVRPNQQET
ncbi:MAG: hydroxymethylbilane synthase, partial [Sedimentisphaerales bacterium]|nr:hydroxymethylbilane synthase [Sedimentisphaerales bacterium]